MFDTYTPCRCGGLTVCYCGQSIERQFLKAKAHLPPALEGITIEEFILLGDLVLNIGGASHDITEGT